MPIQNLQMSPIPQTSFLVGTFFAASYSKTALERVWKYRTCYKRGQKILEGMGLACSVDTYFTAMLNSPSYLLLVNENDRPLNFFTN